jgi:hypothetical protein
VARFGSLPGEKGVKRQKAKGKRHKAQGTNFSFFLVPFSFSFRLLQQPARICYN